MTDCNLTLTQSIKFILFIFFAIVFFSSHFYSVRSISHHSNLLGCRGSHVFFIQTSLGRRRGTSSKTGGTPDCRRSQQNQTLRFAKPEYPISAILSKASDSCSFCVVTESSVTVAHHRWRNRREQHF
jgi:hypothetical protein